MWRLSGANAIHRHKNYCTPVTCNKVELQRLRHSRNPLKKTIPDGASANHLSKSLTKRTCWLGPPREGASPSPLWCEASKFGCFVVSWRTNYCCVCAVAGHNGCLRSRSSADRSLLQPRRLAPLLQQDHQPDGRQAAVIDCGPRGPIRSTRDPRRPTSLHTTRHNTPYSLSNLSRHHSSSPGQGFSITRDRHYQKICSENL